MNRSNKFIQELGSDEEISDSKLRDYLLDTTIRKYVSDKDMEDLDKYVIHGSLGYICGMIILSCLSDLEIDATKLSKLILIEPS